MELHQRIIGQSLGRGFQIGQGFVQIAPAIFDPAIGILKRRHFRASQAARHGKGALQTSGIIVMGGDQAGQVVGNHRVAGVFGVEGLIDFDRPFDIAGFFQRPRLHPRQDIRIGNGGNSRVQQRIRLGLPSACNQQAIEQPHRVFGGRIVGNDLAIDRFGLGRIAHHCKEVGRDHLQIAVGQVFGQSRVQKAARLFRLAATNLGLHDPGDGTGIIAALADLGFQEGEAVFGATLTLKQGDLQILGGLIAG